MINRAVDPRTDDTIVYELLRTPRGGAPASVGRATFRGGSTTVDGPDDVIVAVRELLERGFVDRIQSDERPRGYRRSGGDRVEMLVPGMAEHFIARLRGLWLPYPDGSVVTARETGMVGTTPAPTLEIPSAVDNAPSVTDASIRRATLAGADRALNARPIAHANAPERGVRTRPVAARRTDCGWMS
ncbi:MAG: hypothetical protein ABI622_10945 [Chloroflexota bacterium]